MNPTTKQYTNYKTMAISIVAGVNTSLIAMHAYHLDNSQLQAADTIISGVVTICGVIYSHKNRIRDTFNTFKNAFKSLFKRKK